MARPLLRLGSMFRAPAPAPAPTPAPAPAPAPAPEPAPAPAPTTAPGPPPVAPLVRPTLRPIAAPTPPAAVVQPPQAAATTTSVPSSPAQKSPPPTSTAVPVTASTSVPPSPRIRAAAAPSSSVPASPVFKPVAPTSTISPAAADSTRPVTKPEARTPPPSPKPKPVAPPPSPLTLPPAQLKSKAEPEPKIPAEAEQKTVLVQKTIDKPKQWYNGSPKTEFRENHISGIFPSERQGITAKETGQAKEHKGIINGKKLVESEDGGMKIITIAGENRGAFMEIIQSPKKKEMSENSHHLHKRGTPTKLRRNGDGESETHSGNDEASPSRNGKAKQALPMSAFMNSNVQGVNNSIMYNSSCTHHDPGVHLALSRKGAGGGFQVDDYVNKKS